MNVSKLNLRLRNLGVEIAGVSVKGSAHKLNEDVLDHMPRGNGLRLVVADEISHKVGVAPTAAGAVVRDALRSASDCSPDDAIEKAHIALNRWLPGQGERAAAGVCAVVADIQPDERGNRMLEVASLGDVSVFVRYAHPWPFRPAFRRVVAPHAREGRPTAYLGMPGITEIRSARVRLRRDDVVMLASDGGLAGLSDQAIADLLAGYVLNPLSRLVHVLSYLGQEASLNGITDDRTIMLVSVE